jgi:hypothetical protein
MAGGNTTMLKRIATTALLPIALVFSLVTPSKADIIATIGTNYDGTPDFDFNPADYPLAPVTIGDFTFTIPNGLQVIGGTVSGYLGNEDVIGTTDSTAPSDYFIDNGSIKVAACDDSLSFTDPCETSITQWTYTLTSSDLANLSAELSAGSVDFTAVQNGFGAINTGTTTLDLVLSPEPSMIFLLCGGLAGIGLLRRFRKA